MEALLSQRLSPLLKCVILFLFIFTAKVLTSRPQESLDNRNSIHHPKPAHYVRTFTKYHHRRTIQWNDMDSYWHNLPKVVHKRSVPNSNDFPQLNQLVSESVRGNIIDVSDKSENMANDVLKPEVKVLTTGPTLQPGITCLYKIDQLALSVTPSYRDEKGAQVGVDNEIFGKIPFLI